MPLTRKLASKSLIKQNTNQDVIGTGVTNLVRDAFTGNGTLTVFTLSAAPLSAANTQVFISGVYQNKNTYTISGTTLTFSTPPPNATNIEVISGTNYSIGVPGDGAVSNVKLANAPAYTVKSNNTGVSAAPTDITIPQLAAMFTAPTVTRILDNVTTNGTTITVAGTYNRPANCKYIKVKMAGGGGGGGNGGTVSVAATAGTNTTFGSSLLTANGGSAGASNTVGAAGGSVTINSPAISIAAITGGSGASSSTSTTNAQAGGIGGINPFGGAGIPGYGPTAGSASVANTGAGGSGGGNNNNVQSGSGGGAGGYIEAIINNPSTSYSYSIGSGGNGGTGTIAGGNGATGIIIIEEYYQ